MDYLKLLEESYNEVKESDESLENRLEYLCDYIFEITTYDGIMSALFARKALQVCEAITTKTTLDYIENKENYKWFLIMCNMPFFSNKIEWGTSIRGCWWHSYEGIKLITTGIFINGAQECELFFNEAQWDEFVHAMITFAKED